LFPALSPGPERNGPFVNEATADFEHLVPDVMLDAVEQALGRKMTGLATALPSYINRVYEIQADDGERLIAKFYRPGRWTLDALREEHAFVADCAADEIPVIAPLALPSGDTLHQANGVYFTLFPKRFGRSLEINTDADWTRVGQLLGRVHVAGARGTAPNRTRLHPHHCTEPEVRHLVDHGFVTPRYRAEFEDITSRLLRLIAPLFDDLDFIRLHGDCHRGNLLDRPGEGLMVIDFDDMMMGPPIQDLWLLLPDRLEHCRRELDLLLRGYEMFRDFDDATLRLIEPLRAMRIIYFLAWCSHQVDDYKFRHDHPHWGSDAFWQRENADLAMQLRIIENSL
jgi:Ser/Thr protein kinase RdoA (MazF antagonist)